MRGFIRQPFMGAPTGMKPRERRDLIMMASEYRTTRKIALWVTVSVFALAALTVAAAVLLS